MIYLFKREPAFLVFDLVISSTSLISLWSNVFASENTEISFNWSIDESVTEQELIEGFSQLAELKIDDLITISEQQGIDLSTVFTDNEIALQRRKQMLRAGMSKAFNS